MNAPRFDSPDSPRPLSPQVEAQLTAALKAHSSKPSDDTAKRLQDAIVAAAQDARKQELRSEELVLVFKSIERASGIPVGDDKIAASRNKLIKALLDAYYLAQKSE